MDSWWKIFSPRKNHWGGFTTRRDSKNKQRKWGHNLKVISSMLVMLKQVCNNWMWSVRLAWIMHAQSRGGIAWDDMDYLWACKHLCFWKAIRVITLHNTEGCTSTSIHTKMSSKLQKEQVFKQYSTRERRKRHARTHALAHPPCN